MDNLDVDMETGDIWAAAHPSTFKVIQHLTDPLTTTTSPSQASAIKYM